MNTEKSINEAECNAVLPHVIGSLSFFNADNMAIMKTFKDKEFDLAIVISKYFCIFVSN